MPGNENATNGWDAVLALNHTEVNDLFFQQYLREGPSNPLPGQRLRVTLNLGEGETFWILDAVLGPPRWTFGAGAADATLEMELIKGALIAFDPGARAILHAAAIRPKESRLSGALALSKVTGEVGKLGTVVADLGASAFAPAIVGVDPDSILMTEIGNAVTAYFKHNATTYPIGTIAPGSVAALMPTDFHFAIQQKPGSPKRCVLLLIQTSGPAGSPGPLAAYPIPDEHTAALLLSGRALFGGALPDALNSAFSAFGARFGGADEQGRWVSANHGGAIPIGQINQRNTKWPGGQAWSSNGNHNEAPVSIALDGFSIASAGGKISASWRYTQPQTWSVYNCNVPVGNLPQVCGANAFNTSIRVDYSQGFDVEMSSGNDSVVVFKPHDPIVSVDFTDKPSWWDSLWLGDHVPSAIAGAIQTGLTSVFKNFALPKIQTFTLTSLLFPTLHAVHLKQVALGDGLTLTGELSQVVALTPPSTNLTPGHSVQLSVAGKPASDFLWQIKPNIGSIKDGLYTAPAGAAAAEVVVVSAVSKANPAQVGNAMVLVYQDPAVGGVAVSPGSSLVTPGHQLKLSTTGANKKPLAVDWTLSPNVGKIDAAFGQEGVYTFSAPASVAEATEITATAVNSADRSQVGHAVIRLLPSQSVAVAPEQASLKYGARLELTSSVAQEDADDLQWVIYPVGSGTVAPLDGNHAKATFTAPPAPVHGNQVFVVAYLLNDRAAGLGITRITLTQ